MLAEHCLKDWAFKYTLCDNSLDNRAWRRIASQAAIHFTTHRAQSAKGRYSLQGEIVQQSIAGVSGLESDFVNIYMQDGHERRTISAERCCCTVTLQAHHLQCKEFAAYMHIMTAYSLGKLPAMML